MGGLAFLFSLIALASPYWVQAGKSHYGLWSACTDVIGTVKCGKIQSSSWLNWTRFFMFAEMFLLLGGLILITVFLMKGTKVLGIVAIISMFVGGGCGMVGMALFTDKIGGSAWGWSFGLGWTAWLFAWIGTAL